MPSFARATPPRRGIRIGQLIATLHMGNLSEEQAKKNTFQFATEVMPHLKGIWSEYEDRWTPQGLAIAQAKGKAVAAR